MAESAESLLFALEAHGAELEAMEERNKAASALVLDQQQLDGYSERNLVLEAERRAAEETTFICQGIRESLARRIGSRRVPPAAATDALVSTQIRKRREKSLAESRSLDMRRKELSGQLRRLEEELKLAEQCSQDKARVAAQRRADEKKEREERLRKRAAAEQEAAAERSRKNKEEAAAAAEARRKEEQERLDAAAKKEKEKAAAAAAAAATAAAATATTAATEAATGPAAIGVVGGAGAAGAAGAAAQPMGATGGFDEATGVYNPPAATPATMALAAHWGVYVEAVRMAEAEVARWKAAGAAAGGALPFRDWNRRIKKAIVGALNRISATWESIAECLAAVDGALQDAAQASANAASTGAADAGVVERFALDLAGRRIVAKAK